MALLNTLFGAHSGCRLLREIAPRGAFANGKGENEGNEDGVGVGANEPMEQDGGGGGTRSKKMRKK